jgi:uncharacterized protein (DUF1697 family)
MRAELQDVVARNPFAERARLDPSKVLVFFLKNEPTREACDQARAIKANPEEFRVSGRELYVSFPNGVGDGGRTGRRLILSRAQSSPEES